MAVKMVIYILYQSVYEIIILIFKQTEYLPGPMIALYLPCLFVGWLVGLRQTEYIVIADGGNSLSKLSRAQ